MSHPKRVEKGWGHELWYHNEEYCAKLLHFDPDKMSSMHYHVVKDEVLIIKSGYGWVIIGEPGNLDHKGEGMRRLSVQEGDVIHVQRKTPHRILSGAKGMEIFEASTHHEDEDSIRLEPGD